MPIVNKHALGSSGIVSVYSGNTVSLPSNRLGDHCTSTASSQFFCGYWYYSGWSSNDNSYPDPEDWGNVHSESAYRHASCMYSRYGH